MQFSALAGKPRGELQAMLREEQRRLEQLRTQVAEGTHKNVRQLRTSRLMIAKLQTALKRPPAGSAGLANPSAPAAR